MTESIERKPLAGYRQCPHCGATDTERRSTRTVIESGEQILRRYRRCRKCGRTYRHESNRENA